MTTHEQVPGHLYGPPAPCLAFYYGSHYLGEIRAHPENVRAAELRLKEHADILFNGPEAARQRYMLTNATRVVVHCGSATYRVGDLLS